MEEEQRRALTENLVSFCENLDLTEVLPYLESKRILRENHVELIQSKATSWEKRRELVTLIKQRGPDAFGHLVNALKVSGQLHLAALISPYTDLTPSLHHHIFQRSRTPSPDPEPTIYPADSHLLAHPSDPKPTRQAIEKNKLFYDKELTAYAQIEVLETRGVLEDLVVDCVDANSSSHPWSVLSTDEYYSNFTTPKGLALVINNRSFRGGLPERLGTDVDKVNITRTLQQLGYQVKVKTNQTAKEMMSAMERFARKPAHEKCHSAVVVVLSHGEQGELFGTDERSLSVDHLVSALNARNAPLLRAKPKLFFLQACRGKRFDEGHDHEDRIDTRNGQANDMNKSGDCVTDGNAVKKLRRQLERLDLTDANALRSKIPLEADFLIAYATTPGYVSWRNSMNGSWFIQSLCQVFAKYAKSEDILSMMTKVNNEVATAFQSSTGGYKQMPEPSFRLTRKFYFFPGYSGPLPLS